MRFWGVPQEACEVFEVSLARHCEILGGSPISFSKLQSPRYWEILEGSPIILSKPQSPISSKFAEKKNLVESRFVEICVEA